MAQAMTPIAGAAPVLAKLRVPVTARFRESFDHLVWP
jgi:hypothetical protein